MRRRRSFRPTAIACSVEELPLGTHRELLCWQSSHSPPKDLSASATKRICESQVTDSSNTDCIYDPPKANAVEQSQSQQGVLPFGGSGSSKESVGDGKPWTLVRSMTLDQDSQCDGLYQALLAGRWVRMVSELIACQWSA